MSPAAPRQVPGIARSRVPSTRQDADRRGCGGLRQDHRAGRKHRRADWHHAPQTSDRPVPFSEKAAGELKLRLREELERARSTAGADSAVSGLLDAAVHDFEEAHISTIHTFCADLLRERPVEARVDPAFAVLTDTQADQLFGEVFSAWLHEQLGRPDEGVRRSLRRPVKWRFDDDNEDGPIERLRQAARGLREWRDHDAAWRRPSYDRRARFDLDYMNPLRI